MNVVGASRTFGQTIRIAFGLGLMLLFAVACRAGMSPGAVAVLELIRNEEADMVLHQGDFDYEDDPGAWDRQISDVLGHNFPYFASVGNHEVGSWPAYQGKLLARLSRIDGAVCTGDMGVKSACTYQGFVFYSVRCRYIG